MMNKRKQRWALVLSGGGAKGFAHIGVLKALQSMGVGEPDLIAGTSMGAVVGCLYACGKSPEELEQYALHEFDLADHLESPFFRINGPVGRVFQTGQMLSYLAIRPGLDSGRKVLELLQRLTENKQFSETRIPFRCNAVDLLTGRERIFSEGFLAQAVRASLSFPAFFEPVGQDGQLLVDGGIINNLPINSAREAGIKRILAVDVGPFRMSSPKTLGSGAVILFRCLQVAIHHIERGDRDRAVLTLNADDGSSPFAFNKVEKLIALGERAVRERSKELERFFSPGLFSRIRS